MNTATRLAVLEQKYVIARELRTLAQIQHGRDSTQFKSADSKCAAALAKAEAAKVG
jgi:hypothetical protein